MSGGDNPFSIKGDEMGEMKRQSEGTHRVPLSRVLQWKEIPEPLRRQVMQLLSARDMLQLDSAVSERQEREEMVEAYRGLRSPGFDGCADYTDRDDYAALYWAKERDVNLRNFRLEYKGEKHDQNAVLGLLVFDRKRELATYFATRCDVRDAEISITSDVFFNETTKSSTLIMATKQGYVEIAEALIQRGAADLVNKKNVYGWTLLHHAAAHGQSEMTRVLLSVGADFIGRDNAGWSPLLVAAYNGHVDIVQQLLQAGAGSKAELNKGNERGDTPLSWACRGGHTAVVRVLLEAGADVKSSNRNGWTPLFEASTEGHIEVVRVLIAARADVTKASNDGETALHQAANGGRLPLIVAVMEAGNDMNRSNSAKRSAGGESWRGRARVAQALLEAGADVNKSDAYGRSPLDLALKLLPSDPEIFRKENLEIAALLRKAGAFSED